MDVESFLQSVADATTQLVITTTVGNEVIICGELGGQANCAGTLIGDPSLQKRCPRIDKSIFK